MQGESQKKILHIRNHLEFLKIIQAAKHYDSTSSWSIQTPAYQLLCALCIAMRT